MCNVNENRCIFNYATQSCGIIDLFAKVIQPKIKFDMVEIFIKKIQLKCEVINYMILKFKPHLSKIS